VIHCSTSSSKKDLRFLQLLLLLVNNSCPIKRVDLVWAEDGPTGRVGLRKNFLSTERALTAGPTTPKCTGDCRVPVVSESDISHVSPAVCFWICGEPIEVLAERGELPRFDGINSYLIARPCTECLGHDLDAVSSASPGEMARYRLSKNVPSITPCQ
jgi:hypothetical protein